MITQSEFVPIFAVLSVCGLWVGVSKNAGLGAFTGGILVAILSQFFSLRFAVSFIVPLLIMGDMFSLVTYWREWDRTLVNHLLVGGLLGVVLGTISVRFVPVALLEGILIFAVLSLIVPVHKIGSSMTKSVSPIPDSGIGFLASYLSTTTGIGGPIISAFLLNRSISPTKHIGTFALFFAVIDVAKLPLHLYLDNLSLIAIGQSLLALPAIGVGALVGRLVATKLNQQVFQTVLSSSLLVFVMYMLWRLTNQ